MIDCLYPKNSGSTSYQPPSYAVRKSSACSGPAYAYNTRSRSSASDNCAVRRTLWCTCTAAHAATYATHTHTHVPRAAAVNIWTSTHGIISGLPFGMVVFFCCVAFGAYISASVGEERFTASQLRTGCQANSQRTRFSACGGRRAKRECIHM